MSKKTVQTNNDNHEKLDSGTLTIPVWGLFILASLAVLYFAKSIMIPMFLAIFVSLALSPLISYFSNFKIPRSISSGLLLLIISFIFVSSVNYISEPAGLWFKRLPTEIKQLENKVSFYKKSIDSVQKTTESISKITQIENSNTPDKQKVIIKNDDTFFDIFLGTQSVVTGTLVFLVLLYFLMSHGHNLTIKLGKFWQQLGYQTNILRITHVAQKTVGKYLLCISLINICLGIIVGLVMWILGMPNPMVWGASAAILNFIPYVGPVINLSIITLVSLLTFDTTFEILLPPLILLGLNILEGQFIQPLVVGKVLTINPIIVFTFILFWGWLWGIAGIFMAVPILAVIKVIFDQRIDNIQIPKNAN